MNIRVSYFMSALKLFARALFSWLQFRKVSNETEKRETVEKVDRAF